MRNLFANESFTIEAGHAVSGIAQNPRILRILSGRVWITVEGISQDYWLAAGDMLTVAPGRLVVVEADKLTSHVDTQLAISQHGPSGVQTWAGYLRSKAAQAISKPQVVSTHRCPACA